MRRGRHVTCGNAAAGPGVRKAAGISARCSCLKKSNRYVQWEAGKPGVAKGKGLVSDVASLGRQVEP